MNAKILCNLVASPVIEILKDTAQNCINNACHKAQHVCIIYEPAGSGKTHTGWGSEPEPNLWVQVVDPNPTRYGFWVDP